MLSKNTNAASLSADLKNLFLLNPHNQGLLGESRPLAATFGLTTVMLLLGLSGLLAVVFFFVSGASELFTTTRLINAGIAVPGQIVPYPAGTTDGMTPGLWYPITYRFAL